MDTIPLLRGQYGRVNVDVLEYTVFSEDELFDKVETETSNKWKLTSNDRLELYESDNNSNFVLCMTPNFIESEEYLTAMLDEFVQLLWADLNVLKQLGDIIRLPKGIADLLKLMNDPYLILFATMDITDLCSFADTNFGKSIIHLLKTKFSKWEDSNASKIITYFSIYSIWDNAYSLYSFITNGFTFRYIGDDEACEEEDV